MEVFLDVDCFVVEDESRFEEELHTAFGVSEFASDLFAIDGNNISTSDDWQGMIDLSDDELEELLAVIARNIQVASACTIEISGGDLDAPYGYIVSKGRVAHVVSIKVLDGYVQHLDSDGTLPRKAVKVEGETWRPQMDTYAYRESICQPVIIQDDGQSFNGELFARIKEVYLLCKPLGLTEATFETPDGKVTVTADGGYILPDGKKANLF